MYTISDKTIYSKRIIFATVVFCCFVVGVAFFNYQCDDELYIGVSDYINVPECADYSDGVITVNDSMGLKADTIIAEMPAVHVDSGKYVYDLDHQNDSNIKAVLFDDDIVIGRYEIPADELNTRIEFSSNHNLYNLKISFLYSGTGTATIKRGILYSSNRPFYYDTILYAILIILASVCVSFFLIRVDFLNLSIKEKMCISGGILFLILINYMYFRPFSVVGPDTEYHIARMEATYNELRNGQFPIVMYSDALHGRGMVAVMYPYLLLTLPAILRMIHISADGAIRIFFISVNLATCFTSYYSAKRMTRDRIKATYFMMLYCLLLYRITTMTFRFAYGEMQAFIFMPLVVLGLYELLVEDKTRWMILTIGMSGLIQSHIISTLQAVCMCIVFGVVFLDVLLRDKRIIQVILVAVTTLFTNLWYIVPFLTYYRSDLDTETHLANGKMSYITYYITDMLRLFPNTAAGGQRHHQMGLIGLWMIVMVAVAVYILLKEQMYDCRDRFAITALVLGALFIFAATKTFPWSTMEKFEKAYNMATSIQFSSRLYLGGECLLLFGSMIAISDFFNYVRDTDRMPYAKTTFLKIGAIGLLIVAAFQAYSVSDSYLESINPFTDSRVQRFTADIADRFADDYVPEGYWDDDERFPDVPVSPDAEITDYYHHLLDTEFSASSDISTYVDLPLVYYEGYEAYLGDGTSLSIEKGDYGCIRIDLPKVDNETVYIKYIGFGYWKYAMIVSIITVMVLIICRIKRIAIHIKGDG